MYDLIDAKRSVRKLYTEALIGRGDISVEEAEEALRDYQDQLERVFAETPRRHPGAASEVRPERPAETDPDTAITAEVLKAIGDSQVSLPEGFTVHPRLLPQLETRAAMVSEGGIDWAMGETIAFGSLLLEGRPVRLAGQDSGAARSGSGTRSSSTAAPAPSTPRWPTSPPDQATFYVYDSLLSRVRRDGLRVRLLGRAPRGARRLGGAVRRLRERRAGDHRRVHLRRARPSGASASGVVLLLPHGYEGQGPDHSSARIERFLAMSARGQQDGRDPEHPGQLLPPAAPAGAVRRRKPLVVFTPKSMLRLRAAASAPADFTNGRFQPVIADPAGAGPERPSPRCCCAPARSTTTWSSSATSGRRTDTAIVRVEQLYPLPVDEIRDAVAGVPGDERSGVGAGGAGEPGRVAVHRAQPARAPAGGTYLRRVSRAASASPAAGSHNKHEVEQAAVARPTSFA